MRRISTTKTVHHSMPEGIQEVLKCCEQSGMQFVFKLSDRMQERELSVRALSEITGIRIATISDFMTGKKQSVNLHHLLVLMVALRVSNPLDLIEIKISEKIKYKMDMDTKEWTETLTIPTTTLKLKEFNAGNISNEELYLSINE